MAGNTTILVAVILVSMVLIALLVLRPSISLTRVARYSPLWRC
jgi:hypothetical protein